MSIEDFYEEPTEGLQYSVHPDGTVDVDHSQVTLDDVVETAASNVTDLAVEREKRRKKEEAPAANDDLLPGVADDDDLPF